MTPFQGAGPGQGIEVRIWMNSSYGSVYSRKLQCVAEWFYSGRNTGGSQGDPNEPCCGAQNIRRAAPAVLAGDAALFARHGPSESSAASWVGGCHCRTERRGGVPACRSWSKRSKRTWGGQLRMPASCRIERALWSQWGSWTAE